MCQVQGTPCHVYQQTFDMMYNHKSDAALFLWNIFSKYGHVAFQARQIESFMRIACPQTSATPQDARDHLFRLLYDSPHFAPAPSNAVGSHAPIVGNTGLRSPALEDVRGWFETPRLNFNAYQSWEEGVATQSVSLVCPVLRYKHDITVRERSAEVSQRISELIKTWSQTFRPDRERPDCIGHPPELQTPQNDGDLKYIEVMLASMEAKYILFRRRGTQKGTKETNQGLRSHCTCLETLNLASRIHGNVRLHVFLIGTSLDSITNNPLSWTCLTNQYPSIFFSLAIVLPDEDNYTNLLTVTPPTSTTLPRP
jgi:hypothetical protein